MKAGATSFDLPKSRLRASHWHLQITKQVWGLFSCHFGSLFCALSLAALVFWCWQMQALACSFDVPESRLRKSRWRRDLTKKQGIGNFRVRLNVNDGLTYNELRQLRIDVSQQEQAAELATRNAFINRAQTPEGEQIYLDAKERYLDLKQWSEVLAKEIRVCQPKPKYTNIGNGLYRHDLSNQPGTETPAGVPSQHAQIAPSSAKALYNILAPETIRRTFISMSSLTDQIRKDVEEFLKENHRRKDRAEVVKQIKESCIAKAVAKKMNAIL